MSPNDLFDTLVLIAIVQAFACGAAGALLCEPIDRGPAGFCAGFLLGPIGLVLAWTMRANALLEEERAQRRQALVAAAPAPPPAPPNPRLSGEPRRFK